MRGEDALRVSTVLLLQKAAHLDTHLEIVRGSFDRAGMPVTIIGAACASDVPAGLAVDVVICPTLPWLPEALDHLESVRWIHFLSAGVDAIWGMNFDKHRMLLTKSSGVHGPAMAEYALGAMLHFCKSFDQYIRQSADAVWERHWMDEVAGKVAMILGAGRIGAEVADRCRAFGVDVIAVQRRPAHTVGRSMTLEDAVGVLGEVDFLVVTLPLTDETRNAVNRRMLQALKPGAVVVDISRGGVVDHEAVLELLDQGHLRGAAIDVFEIEPLDASSPLWRRHDVLITPHVSGTTPKYMERAMDVFMENLAALSAGLPAPTAVDLEARY